MPYPNPAIQLTYDRYQALGLVGQIAKIDNNTWYYDVATAGVDLQPGDGVYIDTAAGPTQGQWLKAGVGTVGNVTHVVGFDQTSLNTPLTSPVGNANSEIIYPAGTLNVKALAAGSVYVTAGATIVRGQELQYETTGSEVIVNVVTPKLLIVALTNAEVDDVFPVRVNRIA